MAIGLAFQIKSRNEPNPSLSPEGARVVELGFGRFDHRLAPLASGMIDLVVPAPTDREIRQARGTEKAEFCRRLRQAQLERLQLKKVVARALESLPSPLPLRPTSSRGQGTRRRFQHFRAAEKVIREGKEWRRYSPALYPTIGSWAAVIRLAERAVYEDFFLANERYPAPGSEDEAETDRLAHLASKVLVALIPPEDAVRLIA